MRSKYKIDPEAFKNNKKAQKNFEDLRLELTEVHKRKRGGTAEVTVTHYSHLLYKYLVEHLASQRYGQEGAYTPEKAQKLYHASISEMRNNLEFYIKLKNYSERPKVSIPMGDLPKRTYLLDSNNNLYEPIRFKGPKQAVLTDEDSFTVWFPSTDVDGKTLLSNSKKYLTILIRGIPGEPDEIEIPFLIRRLQEAHGTKDESPGLFQKVTNWFK